MASELLSGHLLIPKSTKTMYLRISESTIMTIRKGEINVLSEKSKLHFRVFGSDIVISPV